MGMDHLVNEQVVVVSRSGDVTGEVKASIQKDRIYIKDERLVIEEGGKILRTLPNGQCESYTIHTVHFHKGPAPRLSHYQIDVRKDSSLVKAPTIAAITINNSSGIQIGDNNVLSIVGSLNELAAAIDTVQGAAEEKNGARAKLKALLSHPLVVSILGAAGKKLLDTL